jgi:hypothetical protein
VRPSVCDHWMQRKVTVDAEKSDGKKQDDCRMESFRGPETQVLRARSWNLSLRAWNPGLESVRVLLIGWSN